MNEHEFAELAAGHALNALSPEDAAAFDAALAEHPEWEHYAHSDAATVAALSDSVAEVPPPRALRSELLERIASVQQDHPAQTAAPASSLESVPVVPTVESRRRAWGPRAWFALAASLVLLVGVGGGAVVIAQQLNQPVAVVALERIEAAPDAQEASTTLSDGGTATVHWSESVGEVVLVSDGLPTIGDDQSYELWFVRDAGAISAGVFEPGDDGDATALLAGEMSPGDIIAVTVEPSGGSPTGAPTSDPIFAIATA
ncbi:MAG: anti-sigma factor [Microbacterium sp.]|uniref:anti-sigma factor n=1 Tax=Microbacterium sp. TaxID=51671 RepID=UPI002718503F|nr:anti-sigma factor [Microbacterium sp.]MDO8381824.1 anti-sigma factor [Microbacterium sp.]